MEEIRLLDGTIDGQSGYALLLPDGDMPLHERLEQSREIAVEREDTGQWCEVHQ